MVQVKFLFRPHNAHECLSPNPISLAHDYQGYDEIRCWTATCLSSATVTIRVEKKPVAHTIQVCSGASYIYSQHNMNDCQGPASVQHGGACCATLRLCLLIRSASVKPVQHLCQKPRWAAESLQNSTHSTTLVQAGSTLHRVPLAALSTKLLLQRALSNRLRKHPGTLALGPSSRPAHAQPLHRYRTLTGSGCCSTLPAPGS